MEKPTDEALAFSEDPSATALRPSDAANTFLIPSGSFATIWVNDPVSSLITLS